MAIAVTGLGLALVLVALVALQYKRWRDGEAKKYEKQNKLLRQTVRVRNKYINALEYTVLKNAGPDELARVLNRVFDEDSDDDSPLSGDASSD